MGKDLIGIAQTGTGKTAGFVLPMIDILAEGRSRARMPRSLILEPTRELAAQVAENFEKYGKYHKLSMALLIGGVQMGDQVKALEKGVDVLIATPGRLMDLFGRGKIMLNGCNLLVIDEADRMLDMGFIPDIEEICTKLPKQRQTLLFSATMPPPIKKLADKFLTNPKTIEVARPATANVNIDQRLIGRPARQEARRAAPTSCAARSSRTRSSSATARRRCASSTPASSARASRVGQIQGDMDQSERIAELDRFKKDEINILVASDVAARGLDIKGVSHVFNYRRALASGRLYPPHRPHRPRRGQDRHRHHPGDARGRRGDRANREADRHQAAARRWREAPAAGTGRAKRRRARSEPAESRAWPLARASPKAQRDAASRNAPPKRRKRRARSRRNRAQAERRAGGAICPGRRAAGGRATRRAPGTARSPASSPVQRGSSAQALALPCR